MVLTLRSSGEEVLAQDTSEGNSSDRETVIVSTGSGCGRGGQRQNHLSRIPGGAGGLPGAGNASVKLEVLKAVSAITGLSSDQISICQRK